ncbi:SIMPL domain-containing protein [Candidatus Binatus sp.]|uniref:SIMPL domain-containing protein n=1 Tax=Candidatus Binatus sp. TaxID=2811406 RepID=UPI003CC56ACB
MKLSPRIAAVGLALATLVAMLGTASAQSDANTFAVRTIEVDGNGETRTSPDTADLDLAIDTRAPTAEEAASNNAALATKVIDALKAKLGDKGEITTGGYSLDPEYDQRPNVTKPTIIGYNAQNSVTVHTGALDLVGALIDTAIAAGANRVNSLNFSVKDDTKARTEAIAIATRDAHAQADALASALNVKLGKVLKATTVSQERPIPIRMGMAMARSAANVATPVEPGQVTVPATVSLTFEIE